MAIPSQEDFVRSVIDHLGITQTKLGKAMGADNAYATAHNWKTGKVRLTYVETMRMLEMCGWLAMDGGAEVARIEPPDGRLESIAAAVGQILQNQKQQAELLQEIRATPEPRHKAAPTRPKRTAG